MRIFALFGLAKKGMAALSHLVREREGFIYLLLLSSSPIPNSAADLMGDSGGTAAAFCVVLLLPLLAAGDSLVSNHTELCTYAVTVETTCTNGAGTSNHVSLRFGDTNSNDIVVRRLNSKHLRRVDPVAPEVLDDMSRKPFQACMVDHFQVTGKCVTSPICYLYLKLSGVDDWRPGSVQVRSVDGPHLSSDHFYFRRVLPRHVWHGFDACRGEVTPFGIKQNRKVVAASKHFRHRLH